jgi:hypothetical protein
MDGRLEWVVGPDGWASSEQPWLGAAPMVTETVVEQVVQARARGDAMAAVARAYGPSTGRRWDVGAAGAIRASCPTGGRVVP